MQLLCPIAALLLALSASCADAAAEGGWWEKEYERDFVQAIYIMIFVLLAISFEWLWHAVKHFVTESYAFGDMDNRDESDEGSENGWLRKSHKKLMLELVDRMGGEFMTLGFLAFIIFLLNNFQFFYFLSYRIEGSGEFHVPASAYDWLHEAEITHMKLFIAMLLYFQTIARLVIASIRKIRKFEKLGLQHQRHLRAEALADKMIARDHAETADLREYQGMRAYFLVRVSQWRHKRPDMFKHLCQALGVDHEDSQASQQVREILDERFGLSEYLAGNLGEGICESIHVHLTTWLGIEVMFFVFALFHWFRVNLETLVIIFAVLAVIVIVLMWYAANRQRSKVLRWQDAHEQQEQPAVVLSEDMVRTTTEATSASVRTPETGVHTRINTERILMRFLQIFNFSVCFVCAATIMNAVFPGGNHSHKVGDIITGLGLLIFVGVLGRVQRGIVPRFLSFMALPPYVDEENFEVLISKSIQNAKAFGAAPVKGNEKDDASHIVWELATLMGRQEELKERLASASAGPEHAQEEV